MKIFTSDSADDTVKAAKEFAKTLKPGDIVALIGDLGAGKTAFVKGVADYFGFDGDVVSPTYTLINEYDCDIPIYHFDVYRLENVSDSDAEWLDEYLFGNGICLIEWADNITEILPDNTIHVEITKAPEKGDEYREIKIC
ncbi:MAG: tRNA (adenosine(37)-N6)-threonylcarbamoyltransferase complex ATPase subunit type 1 TsaE [Clostridiales bacterium]|nr:tRNA (adenosine(37)-N6)-threonylcarbamoyltransferase complex ATPase subunit type 1 TsaE [Clostridiales bacterium]